MLECLAIFVGGASEPQHQLPVSVTNRHHPEADVYEIEGRREPKSHQKTPGPHRPLTRLIRDLQPCKGTQLQILGFERVRRLRVMGKALDLGQPDFYALTRLLRFHKHLHGGILDSFATVVDLAIANKVIRYESSQANSCVS